MEISRLSRPEACLTARRRQRANAHARTYTSQAPPNKRDRIPSFEPRHLSLSPQPKTHRYKRIFLTAALGRLWHRKHKLLYGIVASLFLAKTANHTSARANRVPPFRQQPAAAGFLTCSRFPPPAPTWAPCGGLMHTIAPSSPRQYSR